MKERLKDKMSIKKRLITIELISILGMIAIGLVAIVTSGSINQASTGSCGNCCRRTEHPYVRLPDCRAQPCIVGTEGRHESHGRRNFKRAAAH